MKRISIILATTALLALPAMLLANNVADFPGGETGAQQAASRGFATDVDSAVESSGLRLQVNAFLADESATVISYELRGREAEGSRVVSLGRPALIDASGQTHFVQRGNKDPEDMRSGTWVFPAMAPKAGVVQLEVDGFRLIRSSDGLTVDSMTAVEGLWKPTFTWDGQYAQVGSAIATPIAPAVLGQGAITLTSISQTVTGVVVRGELAGFSAASIQAMQCPGQALVLSDGTSTAWTNCRLGFGDGYKSFEITYPNVEQDFVLPFGIGYPADTEQSNKESEGAKASFQIAVK